MFKWFAKDVCLITLTGTMLLLVSGCGYPEVSPLTYQYSKAIYSIANQKDSERLADVRGQIEDSLKKQELSDQESEWLLEIVADAESGDWASACDASRRMMKDQMQTN